MDLSQSIETIENCLTRLDKESLLLLSKILFEKSKLLPESLLIQVLQQLEMVGNERMVIIAMGHVAVGQKNPIILNRILKNIKEAAMQEKSLSACFKSLVFVTNESAKIANEVILSLMPLIHEHIVKSPLARTRSILFDSDSEFSDVEKRQRPEWKVQQQALLLVEALARVFFID
jgi:hypothetical protein